jgi:phosphoribosylanthranilate isomerase
VTFEVIPALDVAGGRLVWISRRGEEPIGAFGGDPLAAARAFVAAGAPRLHVVDVDLATGGGAPNVALVGAVAGLGVPVQASGGLTREADVDALLEAGADRVVLGSGALANREAAADRLARLGDRVCVGIEADGPTIRPRGGGAELPMWDTLSWLAELEVSRFVLTAVGRAGELAGPDLDGIWALATHTQRPVIAAGGIRSVEDLRAITALDGTVEGAIVGRALHEGLDLAAALAAVR